MCQAKAEILLKTQCNVPNQRFAYFAPSSVVQPSFCLSDMTRTDVESTGNTNCGENLRVFGWPSWCRSSRIQQRSSVSFASDSLSPTPTRYGFLYLYCMCTWRRLRLVRYLYAVCTIMTHKGDNNHLFCYSRSWRLWVEKLIHPNVGLRTYTPVT